MLTWANDTAARVMFRCGMGLSRRRRPAAVVLVALAATAVWLVLGRDDWPARVVMRTPGATSPLAFSHDGTTLATSAPGGISLWDTSSGRKRTTWPVPGVLTFLGTFAPDGQTFAFVVWNGYPQPITIQRLDVTTGRVLSTFDTRHPTANLKVVFDLTFTPDGTGLRAILGHSNGVRELVSWDLTTGQESERRTISCPVRPGPRACSRDGRFMAAVEYGGTSATVWDLVADRQHLLLGGTNPAAPPPPGQVVSCVAFSPDGSTLVVGRDDGVLELWDLATARVRKTLQGHTAGYASWSMQFTPDGARLVSRGEFRRPTSPVDSIRIGLNQWWNRGRGWRPQGEVIVLEVASGQRLGHLKSVTGATLSDDGRILATYDTDLVTHLRNMPAPR